MPSHILLKNIVSLQYVSAHVFSNLFWPVNSTKMLNHLLYEDMVFLQCVFACVFSNMNFGKMLIYNKLHKNMVSPSMCSLVVFQTCICWKMLYHRLHKKCFFPVCICLCPLKCICWKCWSQTLQEYGFQKMVYLQCVFACSFFNLRIFKMQIYTLHKNMFSL